ncbi:MAG: methionine--tRNA ligase, partial [Treponema sp.]|nr:methionine--tRNA ligase [Treponema sp.]
SEVLFTKLEDETIASLRTQYSGSQKDRENAANEDASGSVAAHTSAETTTKLEAEQVVQESAEIRFAKTIDLRVAKVAKIERHPKADKLYIINLELSEEPEPETRIIVSGLVPFYKEDELFGKRIIVAYNLKPAKLRGVESRGMLLAAADHKGPPDEKGEGTERVEVLDAGDAPLGTRVSIAELEPETVPAEIDIDTFFSIPIEAVDNVILCGGKRLLINGSPILTKNISKGAVH